MSRKKIWLISSAAIALVLLALLADFLARHSAESYLKRYVETQSKGKIQLNVEKINFGFFPVRFEIIQPEIRTKDSTATVTGYHIKARNISVSVKSLFTYFLGRPLVIDSIIVSSPVFEVFKYQEEPRKKVTIKDEMGRVYESLQGILVKLNLNYLHIDSASFRINEKSKPGTRPLEVSNMHLTINNFSSEKGSPGDRFLFTNRILLEVFDQEITLADGNHGIKFKKLRLSTGNQTIKLDSCYIFGRQADSLSADFNVFVDSLRISKLDFNLLINASKLKLDSLICYNPDITSNIRFKPKQSPGEKVRGDINDKDFALERIKKMLGNLDIRYLGVINAHIDIVTEKDKSSNVFKIQKTNFTIEDIEVDPNNSMPIKVGRLFLDIQNYTGYTPDSLYVIRFEDIEIINKKILLTNFRFGPTTTSHDLLKREISMKFLEIDDIDWYTLVFEKRITAGHVSLIKPELHLILPESDKEKTGKEKKNPFSLLADIRNKLQIGDLFIEDGSLLMEDLKGTILHIDHLYSGINVDRLVQSADEIEVIDAIDNFSFGKVILNNSLARGEITNGSYSRGNRSIQFNNIVHKNNDESLAVSFDNVDLDGINLISLRDISVSDLSWGKGNFSYTLNRNNKSQKTSEQPASPRLKINSLSGGPTILSVNGNMFEASAMIKSISTDEIVIESGQKPKIKGLTIDGQTLNLHKDQLKNTMSGFDIREKETSTLSNVEITMPLNDDMVKIIVPKLIFSADIYESINGNISVDFIELYKPVISFSVFPGIHTGESKRSAGRLPLFRINKLKIDQPDLINLPSGLSKKMDIKPGNSTFNFIGIKSGDEMIKVDSFRISLIQPGFTSDKIKFIPTGKESIRLTGSEVILRPKTDSSKNSWAANIDLLSMSGLHLKTLKADSAKQTVKINSLKLERMKIESGMTDKPAEMISKNKLLLISEGNISFENGKTRFETFNLTLDRKARSFSIDGMALSQLIDRDTFMKSKQYQSNYIQLRTGKLNAEYIDFNLLEKDTAVNSGKITISDLQFYTYKDKRLPFQHGIEKPLLTELIKKINTNISIDTILLRNGLIEYEEFNSKTDQLGKIKLSKIRGRVLGVKNYNFLQTDSLTYNLYALFMDAADLRVSYAQSYTDTLSGSNLKVIASSFDLTDLNPLLIPFASARIKSGYHDTLRMSAVFRKHIAFGTMRMYYHDLNVEYLNKGDADNPTFMTKSASFLANRIVRTKHQTGKGEVFAERDPEKGFVSYWLKIFIGGVLTNSGVRTDQKQEKKYKRSIKKYKVPPIHNIPVDY